VELATFPEHVEYVRLSRRKQRASTTNQEQHRSDDPRQQDSRSIRDSHHISQSAQQTARYLTDRVSAASVKAGAAGAAAKPRLQLT
jgi:hypothetical protein